jgi:hypothetical protein
MWYDVILKRTSPENFNLDESLINMPNLILICIQVSEQNMNLSVLIQQADSMVSVERRF